MEFLRRLRRSSKMTSTGVRLSLQVDESLAGQLRQLAEREQVSLPVLVQALLAEAAVQRLAAGRAAERWRLLSGREQEVCALVCLGFTNRQIASRLSLSADTVKTHVHSILLKFGMARRDDLRRVLEGWDFSAWVERRI